MNENAIRKILLIICLSHLVIITDAARSAELEIETYSFLTSCNNIDDKLIAYDFKSPVEILNNEFQWANETHVHSSRLKVMANSSMCKLVIHVNNDVNATRPSRSFLVKINVDNRLRCSDKSNYNITFLSIKSDTSKKSDAPLSLCQMIGNENYVIVNATSSFELNLVMNDGIKTSTLYPFEQVNSITITTFSYPNETTNQCRSNEFRCGTTHQICLDLKYQCDLYESCPDGSDQLNCTNQNVNHIHDMSASTTTTTTTTTTQTKSTSRAIFENSTTLKNLFTLVNLNASATSSNEKHSLSFLIGLMIVLIVITSILTGIWFYGRRKRRWRELLEHLDNNSEWEYEQLEDGPSVVSSRTAVTAGFNRNISTEMSETNGMRHFNSNSNMSSNTNRLNERTPIHLN